jgi:hypothetical protein
MGRALESVCVNVRWRCKDLGPTSKGKKLVEKLGRWSEGPGDSIRLTQGRKTRNVKRGLRVLTHLQASKPKKRGKRLMASSHFPTRTRKSKRAAVSSVDEAGIQILPLAHPVRGAAAKSPVKGRLLEMPRANDLLEVKLDEDMTDEELIRARLQSIRVTMRMIEDYWLQSIERRLEMMYPKT